MTREPATAMIPPAHTTVRTAESVPPGAAPPALRVIAEVSPRLALSAWREGLTGDDVLVVVDPTWPREMCRRAAELAGVANEAGHLGARDLVVFTSGSSGQPRAVHRTRESWELSAAPFAELLDLRPHRDTVGIPGPLRSTLFAFGAWHGLVTGCAVVASPVAEFGSEVSVAHVVPAMLPEVFSLREQDRLTGLRTLVVAGDALPAGAAERATELGLRVVEYYGAAELSFVGIRDATADPTGPMRPFPGVDVQVRDGVLWSRSPYRMRGYLGPSGPMRCDGAQWATVGDLAQMRGAGFVVRGRGNAAIATGGHTVVAEEVERFLCTVPGVSDAGVTGVPHPRLGQRIVAVVQAGRDALDGLNESVLRSACRDLPAAARPRAFVLTEVPRAATGKIQRERLREIATNATNAEAVARGARADTISRGMYPQMRMNTSGTVAPVIVAARRTAVATVGKALAGFDVATIAAAVLEALAGDLRELGIGEPIDDVVLGNCLGPGGNPARVAALAAGLGLGVPGLTVDRQCGSGQEAVHLAAAAVQTGERLVLAGGAESASTAPWRMHRPVPATGMGMPVPYARAPFAPEQIGDPDMGEAAESVARVAGISRQRQDVYAALSHERTLAARAAGVFDSELVPVGGVQQTDDRPRRLRLETLARLPAAFVAGGTVTAGNSCGISDGAAAVAVVPEAVRAAVNVPGLAVRGWARVGADPNLPGMCAAPAIEEVLARTGVPLREVGAVEVTEAFASQLLATTDALGLDPLAGDAARVCSQGGAIALGHPWGASGALLVVRLFSRMVRLDGPRFGVAACAIGGGQGVAMLVERVGP